MHLAALAHRGLRYHWRAHIAVALGVLVGTAALTGALLAGDTMRGSLRDAAVGGLGRVDYALTAPRFLREALADELTRSEPDHRSESAHPSEPERQRGAICPAILARGSAVHADSRATANHINIIGADHRFWGLGRNQLTYRAIPDAGRTITLNKALADDLYAAVGDDVLLHLAKPSEVPLESLLGRRDEATASIRLTVVAIIPNEDLGAFSLATQTARPRNAYVPLATLQRALHQEDRVNALFVAGQLGASESGATTETLNDLLRKKATLADLALRLRANERFGYVALESEAFLLGSYIELMSRRAAEDAGYEISAVSAYLANDISLADRPDVGIPYSTIVGIERATDLPVTLECLRVGFSWPPDAFPSDEILLNAWTADQLNAKVNDRIRLTYFVVAGDRQLHTLENTFRLCGIVQMEGVALDRGFVPEYPGLTDAKTLTDWHPPFPINLTRIRQQDETYWEEYGTTPKAYVSISVARWLWAGFATPIGSITSLRIRAHSTEPLDEVRRTFEGALWKHVDPVGYGLRFNAVRERALASSAGANDFSSLFVSFSFFLIASAAVLVALLFRLGVERRASEIGTLLSLGFSPRRVLCLLLSEGALVAVVGAAIGLIVARGYARLVLAALQSWWPNAADVPALRPHDTLASYAFGYSLSILVALASIAWSLRGLTHLPARALLGGIVQSTSLTTTVQRQRWTAVIALGGIAAAVLLSAWPLIDRARSTLASHAATGDNASTQSAIFFGAGTALLIAAVAGVAWWLGREPHKVVRTGGFIALLRLGVRNAGRHRGRSLLTVSLIASASFLIAALQAMRLDVPSDPSQHDSGTGGFTLMAEATVPLLYDLNTPAGRAALNITGPAETALAGATFLPFRLHAGDETSCLNLYRPTQPRLLGAPRELIDRGGFTFSRTLADSTQEQRNPWMLLSHKFPDNAVPAIGDEASVLWQLHKNLGDDVIITDEAGQAVHLRIAGLLSGSVLQGELIVADDEVTRLFPSDRAFWLIDAPLSQADEIRQTLERELSDYGVAVRSTRARLSELFAMQNAYLSAFQALGAVGLLLGTIGLVAVLLRNVWERRSELALLQALGFSRRSIGWLVLSENAALVAAGLLAGWLAAGLAILPHALARASLAPWWTVLLVLGGVFALGMLAALAALATTLRERLLPALRAE